MVATVSPADAQYHHTINTLKYADRAKEIKTHVHKNIGTVDTHVADYQRLIENLQGEVRGLRKELAEKESKLSTKPVEKAADDELSWLNILSRETSENVQERVNLQRAVFELEETNMRNRIELHRLDDAIANLEELKNGGTVTQALRSRRQVILDNIRDNDETGANYKKDIETNEKQRRQLQNMIEEAINNNGSRMYLHILSQYRLLGMANSELQFEMAMRDQIIYNQKEALKNLWNMLLGLGLERNQLMEWAAKLGITIDDCVTPRASSASIEHSPLYSHCRLSPSTSHVGSSVRPYASTACVFQHHQGFSSMACHKDQHDSPSVCREEHHSSYYMLSHDHPHATYMEMEKSCPCGRWDASLRTPEKLARQSSCFHPMMKSPMFSNEAFKSYGSS